MSLVMARWRPSVQVRACGTLISGWKALMLSARFARIAIGNVGVSGNGALNSRFCSRRSTGHDSPGPTNPVLALRVRLSVLPGLLPHPGEVGRAEQARGGIVGRIETEIDTRHLLL